MLWMFVFGWAIGAWLVIAGVAIAMAVQGKWGRASPVLMIAGALLLAASAVAGTRRLDREHGVRPDAAQWITWR